MNRKELLFLIAIFFTGILYRLWIVQLVPQPFVGDQSEYYSYIVGILKNGLHADTIFLYGYPIVIAPLVYVFGFMSKPWILFHAILDSATGILVFVLARQLFARSSRAIPWIALVLYAANPYTSGYVGVLMTEVVAIFILTLIIILALFFFTRKNVLVLTLLAFLLGFFPQVRPSFFFLTVALIVLMGYVAWKYYPHRNKVITIILVIAYGLPFTYNFITNYLHYGQIAPLFVDNYYACEIYVSLLIEKGGPSVRTRQIHVPSEIVDVWNACSAYKTPEGRARIARHYLWMANNVIAANPMKIIQSAGKKIWYVWEKQFLFPFRVGPPLIDVPVYWANILLLISGFAGYFLALLSAILRKNRDMVLFHLANAIIILYIPVAHIFSFAAERFSLPVYPILILYASFSLWKLSSWGTSRTRQ